MNTGYKCRVTPSGLGSLIIAASICFSMSGCGPSEKQLKEEAARKAKEETSDTLLVCEGYSSSLVPGMSGEERKTFIVTKLGEKVTKVKEERFTYTLERAEIKISDNEAPIYSQLIIEPDRLILRIENTGSKNTVETVLLNTGTYRQTLSLGSAEGQCSVAKKAF